MNKFPSHVQFVDALRRIEHAIPTSYRLMLKAHHDAADRTLSTRQLAKAAGYKSWRAVNLHYGKLGAMLRSELGWPGKGQASYIFNKFEKSGPRENWTWIMRPEMARALETLKLV